MFIKSKRYLYVSLFVFGLIISLYSLYMLGTNTYFFGDLKDPVTIRLFAEHFLLFISFCLILNFVKKNNIKLYLIVFLSMLYLSLHQVLIALMLNIVYVVALIILGELLLIKLRAEYIEESYVCRLLNNFVIGSLSYIISICLLSAFKLASIRVVKLYSFGLVISVILIYVWLRMLKITPLRSLRPDNCIYTLDLKKDKYMSVVVALTLSVLLLQLGRLNMAIDYDSVRYGFRSLLVLLGDFGIYDTLGTVNDVYVYPKGLEILTLALNTRGSFSFILSFSYVCALLTLLAVYETVIVSRFKKVEGKVLIDNKRALVALFFAAITPAIINMAISAKTDIITLLMQLISILNMCLYTRVRKLYCIVFSLVALLSSLVYKPTAPLFSFAVGCAAVIYLCLEFCLKKYYKKENIKKENFENKKSKKSFKLMALIFYPLTAIVLVFARTYILTGHIITSVYSSIWYKLGIETHFPYTVDEYNSAGMNLVGDAKVDMAYRLYQLFIAPTKEEHIYIASPTVLLLVLIVLGIIYAIIYRCKNKNRERNLYKYLMILFIAVTTASSLGLYMIHQIDGNYFILFFCLVIINVCLLIEADDIKRLLAATTPCIFFAITVLSITNWAGVKGLTPAPIAGREFGFYNHHDRKLDTLEGSDFREVYYDLTELGDPRTLLMSDDNTLLHLCLDIRVYADVVGSGGNVAIVKTLDNFKRYLKFAGIEYICTEENYLAEHDRARDIIEFMLEDGSLEEYKSYKDVRIYRVKAEQF